ncbi:MAG: right-handed parallel beta-helix repeat-containing protein, partial [Planctomycetes bacterium]|nr:right-handed parallel beta-helix repeat-containing protein [Planctomycetota bacterium]
MKYFLLKIVLVLPAFVAVPTVSAADPPPVEITSDVTLNPTRVYGPLVVKASHITIDGRGATVQGTGGDEPKTYQGVGISADGVSGVTLRNVKVKGWETGLRIRDGHGWLVEGCDMSDNFHDPEFGWGENGRRGGIVAERVTRSTFRANRAHRVWDGCVLVESHENTLEDNDFSQTSNTCLKLWNACRNQIRNNRLRYGIRIRAGEVHARDSACVLIESGSNENRFSDNDCTHGGDGIFIRVLNSRVSSDNVFEDNDCSYANNNGFEAWAPRNVYRRNRANHCSYGFWLGASDQTKLIDNEASFNGLPDGHHNSPHLPNACHAGIVFMFGPSSHTIATGNTCVGNHGAGIALIGDLETSGGRWKAFHWIIQQNTLEKNRWGIYLQHADWIHLAANRFSDNRDGDIHTAGNVTNMMRYSGDPVPTHTPRAVLKGPATARVGQRVQFDACTSSDPTGRPLHFRWDLGDGTIAETPSIEHTYCAPGFYRVGLTVHNGLLADLGWRDFYVIDDRDELATEGHADRWTWIDPDSRVVFTDDDQVHIAGRRSVLASVDPY